MRNQQIGDKKREKQDIIITCLQWTGYYTCVHTQGTSAAVVISFFFKILECLLVYAHRQHIDILQQQIYAHQKLLYAYIQLVV